MYLLQHIDEKLRKHAASKVVHEVDSMRLLSLSCHEVEVSRASLEELLQKDRITIAMLHDLIHTALRPVVEKEIYQRLCHELSDKITAG